MKGNTQGKSIFAFLLFSKLYREVEFLVLHSENIIITNGIIRSNVNIVEDNIKYIVVLYVDLNLLCFIVITIICNCVTFRTKQNTKQSSTRRNDKTNFFHTLDFHWSINIEYYNEYNIFEVFTSLI